MVSRLKSKTLQEDIVSCFARGLPVRLIAGKVGVSYNHLLSTLRVARDDESHFLHQTVLRCDEAKSDFTGDLVDVISRQAREEGDWKAARWLLERLHREFRVQAVRSLEAQDEMDRIKIMRLKAKTTLDLLSVKDELDLEDKEAELVDELKRHLSGTQQAVLNAPVESEQDGGEATR